MPPIQKGILKLVNGKASVTGQLDEPGFLLCQVTGKVDGKAVSALRGAGISPLLIKPSLPAPDDFDAFWRGQKKKLAAVPMNPQMTPVSTKAKGAFVTVGFIDRTCPPTSVYAAYNNLPIPKQIYNDLPTGHANSPAATRARDKAVFDYLKSVRTGE